MMKKKALFVISLTALLVVAVFMFFKNDAICVEPQASTNLASEEGEKRTNGPGEFFLPVRSELE